MQETFRRFIEIIKSKVTQEFNQFGEFPPTWFLDTGNNRILELITPFQDDAEKEIYDLVMRHAIKEHKVQRYVYVSEVWIVVATATEKEEFKYTGPPPRERNDRKEALMLSAEDISGERASGLSEIYRRSDINLAMITEIQIDDDFQLTGSSPGNPGRFINMFQYRGFLDG